MLRENVSLDDRYAVESGRIILSGIQALVRLPLLQARRDAAAGLNTAGFISGYRGSPLGGLDQALWGARTFLDDARVKFQPGLNEDLAATAVWGSQQVGLFPGAKHDGVFGMWYGKAPGVDRSGDAFRHANAAGSAAHGGVLAVAGDDHGCKSSTLPSQSEYTFMDLGIPVLNPASVQDILDYGQLGWAMSRYGDRTDNGAATEPVSSLRARSRRSSLSSSRAMTTRCSPMVDGQWSGMGTCRPARFRPASAMWR